MIEIITHSPEETQAVGIRLSRCLKRGDAVCLSGTLGAGKTLLVQGIAEGFGIGENVTSPTFTIMHVYEGDLPLYHFDLYRLDFPAQLFDIGFDEYVYADGVALIEWADKFPDNMPEECLWLEIKTIGASERQIIIKAAGAHYQDILEGFK